MDSHLEEFSRRISSIRRKNVKIIYEDFIEIGVKDLLNKINGEEVYVVDDLSSYNRLLDRIDEHLIPYIFYSDEIYFCPLDHSYVPCHELVTDLSSLERFGKRKFPRISFKDPVVKWNGWKCDSYIKIYRTGEEIFYRHLYCSKYPHN
jgi:DNA-directed RNA polymerase subunit H (RpoH/RPB5)